MNEQNNPRATAVSAVSPAPKAKNKLWWSLIFLIIAAASIWAMTTQSRSFSLAQFWEFVTTSDPVWIAAALCAMLSFIVFEGLAVLTICRAFGRPQPLRHGFMYSASDIYFSAITPSATGGQPASAFFMMQDGIPGPLTTVILVTNLILYTLSIVLVGGVTLLVSPSMFLRFSLPCRCLILVGMGVQCALVAGFILMLKKDRWLLKIGSKLIHLLAKIKVIRKEEARQKKLEKSMDEYHRCSEMLVGKRAMLVKCFAFNLLQRLAYFSVTMFTYLAAGGAWNQAFNVFSMQCYTTMGANWAPIPGAIGVTDFLLLDGFGSILKSEAAAVNLELLSRSLSFYVCVLACGAIVLIGYFVHKIKVRRKNK